MGMEEFVHKNAERLEILRQQKQILIEALMELDKQYLNQEDRRMINETLETVKRLEKKL